MWEDFIQTSFSNGDKTFWKGSIISKSLVHFIYQLSTLMKYLWDSYFFLLNIAVTFGKPAMFVKKEIRLFFHGQYRN